MQIRVATAADVSAIAAIARGASTAAQWSREEYDRLFAAGEEGVRREVLVIESEGVIEGFLVGLPLGPEWELENVVVIPERRGQGLGTELVTEFLDQARESGAERVYLEVRQSNEAARILYEKCGFGETGRRQSYYQDPPEDALLYAVMLKEE